MWALKSRRGFHFWLWEPNISIGIAKSNLCEKSTTRGLDRVRGQAYPPDYLPANIKSAVQQWNSRTSCSCRSTGQIKFSHTTRPPLSESIPNIQSGLEITGRACKGRFSDTIWRRRRWTTVRLGPDNYSLPVQLLALLGDRLTNQRATDPPPLLSTHKPTTTHPSIRPWARQEKANGFSSLHRTNREGFTKSGEWRRRRWQ